jgi:hypothetical protein
MGNDMNTNIGDSGTFAPRPGFRSAIRSLALTGALALAAAVGVSGAAQATTGLSGDYYDIGYDAGNVANALDAIAGMAPTVTFTATTVCFPNCGGSIGDGVSLADFLGGNATNISANTLNDVSGHVLVLTGSIYAANAGDANFSLGSDDGSQMWVNNALAVNNDGDHGFNFQSADVALTAGWNTVKIVQYENGGGTGLTVLENGAALGGAAIASSAVPEPSTWVMMLSGLAGLGFIGYRRKNLATVAA